MQDKKSTANSFDGIRPAVAGFDCQEPLGEGAMGVVWRATQLSTHREVALKLLPSAWLGSREMQLRFEREVEIAASLEHPHIARVYDSGLRAGGYYYAMQLIEGLPLDAYVEINELTEPQLLRLFLAVCDAVNHAHLRGVIHRDLKFSNVMVTKLGDPFVLDFGLAKPVAPAAGQAPLSMAGEFAGTPQFMSPEQARADKDLDTRTDAYSLGVMLYKAITHHFPHEVPGGYLDLLRKISSDDPVRPSRYAPKISPDLEAILLKALALRREERYASAGDLAADLQKFMAQEPVSARPITPLYVTRTWLRKRRVGVAVSGVIALALVSLAGYSIHRIQMERDVAQGNFGVARSAIWDFFVKIGDRELDRQPGMTGLRLMLLQSAKGYYDRLESHASADTRLLEDHGRLLNVLAEQQFLVRDDAGGERSLKESLALHEQVLAAEPTNGWVMLMMSLGHDRLARLSRDRSDETDAQEHAARALDFKQDLYRQFPDSAPIVRMLAYSYDQVALDLRRRRDEAGARPMEELSLAMKKRLAELHPENQSTLRMLAYQYGEMAEFYRTILRDLKRAQEMEAEAFKLKEQLAKANPEDAANQAMLGYSYSSLARQHMHLREYELGQAMERKAFEIKKHLLDADPGNPKHIQAVAYSLTELAQYDVKVNDLDAARQRLAEAIGMNRDLVERDARSAAYKQNLAMSLDRLSDVERRAAHFDQALALYDESHALLLPLHERQANNGQILEMLICNRVYRLDTLLDAGRLDTFAGDMIEADDLLAKSAEMQPISLFFQGRILAMKAWGAAQAGSTNDAEMLSARAVKFLRDALKRGVVPPESPFDVAAFRQLWERPDFEELRPAYLSALAGDLMREPEAIPAIPATDTARLLASERQFVSVEGRVLNCGEAAAGSILFLNFNVGRQGFSAIIRRDQLPSFLPALGDTPKQTLPNRDVTLNGTITIENGRPVMELLWPSQLALHAAAAPPARAAPIAVTPAAAIIGWDQAKDFVGQHVTVTGTVTAAKNTGRICFLDLNPEAYHHFRLPVFQETFAAWPDPPENHFRDKAIRVTGTVIERNGIPQIEVHDAAQIEIAAAL